MDKGVNYESATYPTGAFIIFTHPTVSIQIFWLIIVKLENSKRMTT